MPVFFAFASGLVFGAGLLLSRMADPSKVLQFLDLAGAWDPSLAFVMAGALVVAAIGFALGRRRAAPFFDTTWRGPTSSGIDRRLVIGGLLFGVGWGLAGFCPGPALVALGLGRVEAVIFVAAMLAGMAGFAWWERRAAPR